MLRFTRARYAYSEISNLWSSWTMTSNGKLHASMLPQCLEETCSRKVSYSRVNELLTKSGINKQNVLDIDDMYRFMKNNNFQKFSDLILDVTRAPPMDLATAEVLFNKAVDVVLRKDCEGDKRRLIFPKELIFLCGAPGAGKGSVGDAVIRARQLSSKPIVVSDLLTTPEANAKKQAGELFSDSVVLEFLLRELLRDEHKNGVVIDGFPRTIVQTQCVPLLYSLMMSLRAEYAHDRSVLFRRPVFHIVVLFVSEEVSIGRQTSRGQQDAKDSLIAVTWHYDKCGSKVPRSTDMSLDMAKKRYKSFREETLPALNALRDTMPFHLVDANGSIVNVINNIEKELSYQSELELGHGAYELIETVPLATEVVRNAYQLLVERLETYNTHHHELFMEAVRLVHDRFLHIIEAQFLSGKAVIRSEHPVLQTALGKRIVADILAERGYLVALDSERVEYPEAIDLEKATVDEKGETWVPFKMKVKTLCHFEVRFPPPELRRSESK